MIPRDSNSQASTGGLPGERRAEVRELDEIEHRRDARRDLGARQPILAQTEGHVVGDGHVREERVGLEHHIDRPRVRRHARHILPVDEDAPRIGAFESDALW